MIMVVVSRKKRLKKTLSTPTKGVDCPAGDAMHTLLKVLWQVGPFGFAPHARKEKMPKYEAILLLSFGGPESEKDVIPFLKNVTSGKTVPLERIREVQAQYDLFGGASPINQQNRDLINALAKELNHHKLELPIYFGNRNWKPFLQDTVNQIVKDGHRRVLTFVTSAFGSYSGCRQYQEDIDKAIENTQVDNLTIDKIRLFWNHPKYLSAVESQIEKTLSTLTPHARAGGKLLFSAHSIPKAWAKTSPYTSQLETIAKEMSQRVAPDLPWDLVFQSRSGPPTVPWLEPDITDYIDTMDTKNQQTIIVIPIGFLSDHMEVQFDLDTQAASHAKRKGIQMVRVPTVGLHKTFVAMIRELIEEVLEGKDPEVEIGTPWECTPECCTINANPESRRRKQDKRIGK